MVLKRRTKALVAVIIAIALLVIVAKSNSSHQPTEHWGDSDRENYINKENYLNNIPSWKKNFEKQVSELLVVSTDDILRSGFGPNSNIDFEKRRTFFTPYGWGAYQVYVTQEKKALNDFRERQKKRFKNIRTSGLDSMSLKCVPEFDYVSQEYTETHKGAQQFVVKGNFIIGEYDAMDQFQDFKITISFSQPTPERFLIQDWKVTILKQYDKVNGFKD